MVRHIDLNPDGVTVDGRAFGFPFMVDVFHRGIDAHYLRTEFNDKNAVYTWDEFGLKGFGDVQLQYMAWLHVYTSVDPDSSWNNNPRTPYAGRLTVEGVPIEDVEFRDGWKEGLRLIALGPYLLADYRGSSVGDYFELYLPNVGSDHFTRTKATTP